MSIFGNIFGEGGLDLGGYPIVNKGDISVNTDFPLLTQVESGWLYNILADVTDNAGAPYTNTNLSFFIDDKIYWTGTTWTLAQTERIWLDNGVIITKYNSGNDIDLSNGVIFLDTLKAKNGNGIQLLDKDNVLYAILKDGGLSELYEVLFKNRAAGNNDINFDTINANEYIDLIFKRATGETWRVRQYNDVPAFSAHKNRMSFLNSTGADVLSLRQDQKVGVNTYKNRSSFEVNGSKGNKLLNVTTAAATLGDQSFISVYYTSTGTVDITIPAGGNTINDIDNVGRYYRIADVGCNAGTNRIRIIRSGADTIITTTPGNTFYDINEDGKVVDIQQIGISTWKVC